MNEDETTQTLSDKVLDRANVLRFGKPAERRDHEKPSMARMNSGHSISAKAWKSWKKNDIRQYADACSGWTKTLNNALSALGRAFGFRVDCSCCCSWRARCLQYEITAQATGM